MTASRRDLGSRFDPFNRIDEEGPKLARLAVLATSMARLASVDLVEKVRAGHTFGTRLAEEFARVASQTIYEIPTPPDFVLSPRLERVGTRFRANIVPTPVPFYPTEKGSWLLCFCIHANYECGKFDLKVAKAQDAEGHSRTLVVSTHVCRRINERYNIKGSPVAFIAEALFRGGGPNVVAESNTSYVELRARDGALIGYCPLEPVECELIPMGHGKPFGSHLFTKQPRWRLKTFRNDERLGKRLSALDRDSA